MASAFLKLLTLTLFLDIFIFLMLGYAVSSSGDVSTAPVVQGTFFDVFFEDPAASKQSLDSYANNLSVTTSTSRSYRLSPSGNFTAPPFPESGATVQLSSGGFSFIDGIKMILSFLSMIWETAMFPINLMTVYTVNPLFAILIGIPLLFLNVLTFIIFIRGGGAV